MNENKYQSRLREFRKEIRRTHIENIKKELRMAAVQGKISIEDICLIMKLDPANNLTLKQIAIIRSDQLAKPPLQSHKIYAQGDLHIDAHIRFWKFCSQQLLQNQDLYFQQILHIFQQILSNYTYQQIHHNIVYQLHLLNTLQLICEHFTNNIKDQILSWIAGPEGLRVIQACIDGNHFLSCKEYRKVYKVIELGLKSQMRQENQDAAAVLFKTLRNADWDQNYQIYSNFHGLMIYLCTIIERYYKDGSTRIYSQTVMLLLDGYDEAILDYARTGVAYSAALLICSPHQSSRFQGLCILRVLSQVDNRQMIALFLDNKDMESTQYIKSLFQTKIFSKSGNVKLREAFYSLVANLFSHSNQEQVVILNNQFSHQYEDIFDLLAEAFLQQENPLILKSCINCLQSLTFYGQREQQQNLYLCILQKKQIIKSLHRLRQSNVEQISTLANDMLHNFKIY